MQTGAHNGGEHTTYAHGANRCDELFGIVVGKGYLTATLYANKDVGVIGLLFAALLCKSGLCGHACQQN